MKKVFITKHALSKGIEETETDILQDHSLHKEYIYMGWGYRYYIGEDCFLTKEEAVAKAEGMRKKKIKSLQEQIKKLENMKFKK